MSPSSPVVPHSRQHLSGLAVKIAGIVFWGLVVVGLAITFVLLRGVADQTVAEYELRTDQLAGDLRHVLADHAESSPGSLAQELARLRRRHQVEAIQLRVGGDVVSAGDPSKRAYVAETTLDYQDWVDDRRVPSDGRLRVFYPSVDKVVDQRRKRLLALMGGSFLLFGFVLQWVLQRVLTRPIMRMVETAQAVSDGDNGSRFDEARTDELGFLARFINQSLDHLTQQRNALSETVAKLRQSEADLVHEKERAVATLQSIGDAVITADAAGYVEYLNPVAERLTEWELEEIKGRHIEEIGTAPGEGASDTEGAPLLTAHGVRELIHRGAISNIEKVFRAKSGRKVPVLFSGTVMRDKAGDVQGIVCAVLDITGRKQAEEELHHLAYHDTLTGLPNRFLFRDRLEQAILRAKRAKTLVGLLFLDLDNFKEINDTLGHDTGDQLLKSVGERLRANMRESDTVARLGGDEFTVIVEAAEYTDEVAEVAQKVLELFATSFVINGKQLHVTTSIGAAMAPQDDRDAETLIKDADIAMYHAKDLGRNSYAFYDKAMTVNLSARLTLTSELRRALANDEFRIHYQPIVDTESGATIGLEALLRWAHPQRGMVAPSEFIPILEETGMIEEVTRWVVQRAASETASLQAGNLPLSLAANISPYCFRQRNIDRCVTTLADDLSLDPADLVLEITESVLMEETDAVKEKLTALKAKGVRIALDDFGTGQSSLSHLRHFPIDIVKIDREFVRDVPEDKNDVELVNAIIALGHSLEKRIVAEGVETRAQLEFLKANGCDAVQGYYFAPALSAGDLEQYLNGQPPAVNDVRR